MKKYFYLAAAALTLAACSSDETTNAVPDAPAEPIMLTACVGEATQTRAGADIQSQAFEENELIKVECTPSAGGTTSSVTYKAGAPSANVNSLTAQGSALTWPASGTVAIKAFYPSTVTSSIVSFTVNDNQTDATNYKGSDLMYATPISDQAKVANVSLTFNHALAKIVVNMTAGDGLDATDIGNCTVTLHAKKTATIGSGAVTKDASNNYNATGDAVTITMGTGSSVAAIIVPQTITASASSKYNFITITTAGNHSVTYQLSTDKTFDAGKVYTYSLKVSMSAITLQSNSITDWDGTGDDKTINETSNPLTL